MNKLIYRFLCFLLLIFTLYTIFSAWSYQEAMDIKILLFFLLSVAALLFVSIERKKNYDIVAKQEKELLMYRLYAQPLEELVNEIRMRQHEMDNHMNAILNMHLTIDSYDELVLEQSKYVKEIYDDHSRQFVNVLKISDKVLAGFLYSKIRKAKDFIYFDIHVEGRIILSQASLHDMIEVVGTLFDNAVEACNNEWNQIKIVIGSKEDRLVFEIWNQYKKLTMEEIGRFFERGYSKKDKEGKRGLGLFNAKMLIERCNGDITVSMDQILDKDFVYFKVRM